MSTSAETALSRSILKGLYDRSVMTKVASWIASHDTANTVYHLHGWSKILSPSIFAALSPVARRVVIHAHDFFLVCPNGGYFDYQKKLPCDRTPLSLRMRGDTLRPPKPCSEALEKRQAGNPAPSGQP